MSIPQLTDSKIIAITGATGFIGSAVARQAIATGYRVRALRRSNSNITRIADLPLEWVTGDMTNPNTWDQLLSGCSALLHLAAAGVAKVDDVLDAVHTNLPSLAYMLQAAAKHQVQRIIMAGSCFEYGRTGERIGRRGLCETDQLDPTNAYAAAKAAATLLVGPLSRDLGLQVFILRPFHTYGAGELPNRLIPLVIRMALSGEPIKTTDGRPVRDLVHIDDVARGFIMAIDAFWSGSSSEYGTQVLNLGTGVPTPLHRVIEKITVLCGRSVTDIKFGSVPHRPYEMWRLVADSSAAAEVLGWSPLISLGEGLNRAVETALPNFQASKYC